MAKFNLESYLQKIQDRKVKEIESSSTVEERDLVYERYFEDRRNVVGIERLVYWSKRHRIVVKFRKYYFGSIVHGQTTTGVDPAVVIIGPQLILKRQLFNLMHELGHIITERKKNYSVDYPYGWNIINRPDIDWIVKQDRFRIDIISEEFAAWNEGRKLAERLGVDFDRYDFDMFRTKQLVTYCKWVVGYGNFKNKQLP